MVSNDILTDFRKARLALISLFKTAPSNISPSIDVILEHANRVVEHVITLSEHLELSDEEQNLAEFIALAHDIGRFWTLLPENSDRGFANRTLATLDFLESCTPFLQLEDSTQQLIKKVIRNIDLPDLPHKESDVVLLHIKMIKDGDRLAYLKSTADYFTRKGGKPFLAAEMGISDKPLFSEAICENILEDHSPHKEELKTFNDFVIFQMAWVFELNFKKSFQILNQKQYIRYLYESLPKRDCIIEVYRKIKIHIENQI